jgi:hypothetical protein
MRPQISFESRVNDVTMHIMLRLATAAADEVQARYDFGIVLLTLREAHAGRSALRVLAERYRFDPSALRRYARVCSAIFPDEFTWLAGLRTCRGMPLSWSHIELLAREPSRQRRKELAIAVLEDDLSVRELSARL